MTRIFANAKYDFIGLRRRAYIVTRHPAGRGPDRATSCPGINYSVEFTGGTLVQIETKSAVDVGNLRTGLDQAGVLHAEIQQFGSDRRIRDPRPHRGAGHRRRQHRDRRRKAVTSALDKVLGRGTVHDRPDRRRRARRSARELRQKALFAILLSFLAVLAYLAYRFEWRFGLAAVIATAHDILTTLGFIAVMRIEVSLVVVARRALDGRLLAQRHHHHLRPGPREPAQDARGDRSRRCSTGRSTRRCPAAC